MPRSATEIMQEIVYSAVVDSLDALKAGSKGVPNTLLRDLNAIHANATFSDLPAALQAAITASVRSAFNRLLKEGYTVVHRDAPTQRTAQPSASPPATARRRPPPRGKPPEVTRKPKPRGPRQP